MYETAIHVAEAMAWIIGGGLALAVAIGFIVGVVGIVFVLIDKWMGS